MILDEISRRIALFRCVWSCTMSQSSSIVSKSNLMMDMLKTFCPHDCKHIKTTLETNEIPSLKHKHNGGGCRHSYNVHGPWNN